jgi:hypothetical protein
MCWNCNSVKYNFVYKGRTFCTEKCFEEWKEGNKYYHRSKMLMHHDKANAHRQELDDLSDPTLFRPVVLENSNN